MIRSPDGRLVHPVLAVPFLLAIVTFSACASGARRDPGGRHPGRFARADDWITLADFRHVRTVAVGSSVAYLGTTEGLERLRTAGDRWLSPLTEADGLPHRHVTALAVDPTNDDAWVGTARGLVRLIAFTGEVEPTWGPPPARVDVVRVDPRSGSVYARVAGSWWTGRGGSPVLSRIAAPPRTRGLAGPVPADALGPSEVPWSDPLYVRSPLTSGLFRLTEVDRDLRGDWYAGTWGDNGRRWGAGVAAWEPLWFGLAGPPGGPVVRAADGYWFFPGADAAGVARAAGESREVPAAAAHADPALERWRYAVAGREPGLPSVEARAAVATGDTVWMASPMGLVRGIGRRWSEVPWSGRRRGIAPTALAASGSTLWVGTERGLIGWNRAAGRATERLLDGRVHAIAVAEDDAVYAGTDRGVFEIRPAAGDPERYRSARLATRGTGVRALALAGARLVAATDAGLEIYDREAGTWTRTLAGEGRIPGRALAVAADARQVWIGTTEGLVRWRTGTGEWVVYRPVDGLAGLPVRHLLAEEDVVWASTPDGVSRFDWRRADP